MKVAIYARRSQGQEPEVQAQRLRRAAEAEGHEVYFVATDVATGRNPNRPGWKRVMEAVRGGHVRAVWVTKVDRAMRNSRHYLDVVDAFLQRGCHLRVLDQPQLSVLDKDDPMSRAFRTIGAAFAQLEVDLADERSNEGHQVIDGRTYGPSGKPVGRPAEFGAEHKFRVRDGRRVHDKAKCRACKGGETGGPAASGSPAPAAQGVAEPFGFATLRNDSDESSAPLLTAPATAPGTQVSSLRGGEPA